MTIDMTVVMGYFSDFADAVMPIVSVGLGLAILKGTLDVVRSFI